MIENTTFVKHIFFLEIDECTEEPCRNGATCQDGFQSYTCYCAEGFAGEQCQIGKTPYIKDLMKIMSISMYILLSTIPSQTSLFNFHFC